MVVIGWQTETHSDHSGNTGASIGTFLSSIDEDGYYKVEINLPQTRQSSV